MVKPAKKRKQGRPVGTLRGRKPKKSIAFDEDILQWLDGMKGTRSANVNALLKGLKDLTERASVKKY